MSAFALEDDVVYHTYSTYARSVDPFFDFYHWLDRAPKGRNEPASGFAATPGTPISWAGSCLGTRPPGTRSKLLWLAVG